MHTLKILLILTMMTEADVYKLGKVKTASN